MNIETQSKVTAQTETASTRAATRNKNDAGSDFAGALREAEEDENNSLNIILPPGDIEAEEDENNSLNIIRNGLESAVKEVNKKLNGENEADSVINNDMNIVEAQEQQIAAQINLGMNFNENGQPFSEYMNNENEQRLTVVQSDISEEQAILSTMEENIAIADRNKALIQKQQTAQTRQTETTALSDTKTVVNDEGIKKVDRETNITVETVVKYDSVIMDKSDADFFTSLVEYGAAPAVEQTAQSSRVSQTLADLLAKSMNENTPVRIDFDNDISVIIRVSKDGKISADFLPSSQIAEAYLKENLPLLRQKFDENNIEYDELNQRKQKQDDNDKNNPKKGQQDE